MKRIEISWIKIFEKKPPQLEISRCVCDPEESLAVISINETRNAVAVNRKTYPAMITDYFWTRLEGIDLTKVWFQQDGATYPTAQETIIF